MKRDKNERESGMERLSRLQPPPWVTEMRKYYVKHGTVRPEDVARLLGDQPRAGSPLTEAQRTKAVELLQQMARKRAK